MTFTLLMFLNFKNRYVIYRTEIISGIDTLPNFLLKQQKVLTYVKIYLIISIRSFVKLQRNSAEILNIVEMVNVSK